LYRKAEFGFGVALVGDDASDEVDFCIRESRLFCEARQDFVDRILLFRR
jgi:hypothetical protein